MDCSMFETRKANREHDHSDQKWLGSKMKPSSIKDNEADLLPQLRAIFLVQQIFKCSLHDEGTLKVMQALGDPSQWFQICGRCCDLVDRGIDLFRKLKKCEEEYRGIRGKLEREAFQSRNEPVPMPSGNHILVRNETTENSRIRLGFRRKLWEHGVTVSCQIKEEPELMSDEDDWTPISEPLSNESSESWVSFETNKQQGKSLGQRTQLNSVCVLPTTTEIIPETAVTNFNFPRLRNPPKWSRDKKQSSSRMRMDKGCNDDDISDKDEISDNQDEQHDDRDTSMKGITQTHQETQDIVEDERLLDITKEDLPARQLPKPKKRKRTSDDDDPKDPDFRLGCKFNPYPIRKKKKKGPVKPSPFLERISRIIPEDEIVAAKKLSSEPLEPKRNKSSRSTLKGESEEEADKCNQDSIKRGTPLSPEDMKLFYEKCPEYLDMSLVVYPPESEEDKAKIPKSIKFKDKRSVDGSVREGEFPCPSCKKSFNNKFYTIAHIHRVHLGIEKPWRCNQCSYRTIRARRFRLHVTDHKDGKLKICPTCNTSFRHQGLFECHFINHQRRAKNRTCSECQQCFNSFKEYVKHMTEEHGFHYSTRTQNQKLQLVCELCSKILTSKRSLEFHKVKYHNEEEPTNKFPKCSECNKIFIFKAILEEHMQKHHSGENSNAYFCEFCGKEYKTLTSLASHRSLHAEKPQQCKLCEMQVRSWKKLLKHMNRHHKEAKIMTSEELEEYKKKKNEEMAFKCNQCTEAFPFSVLLYHHYRRNHIEVTNKFKCDLCGKAFSRQSSVKRHYEDTHMNLTKNCEFCGKEFSKGDSLAQHKRNHCSVKKQKDQEQVTNREQELGFQIPVLPNTSYEEQHKTETSYYP